MRFNFSIFFILFVRLVKTEIYSKVSVNLLNTGFHRDLVYTIEFKNIEDALTCEFTIVQDIPASVYVNLDQLYDLKQFKKIFSYVPTYINVEDPAEKSSPFTIYLFGVAKSVSKISLPIHFRYHSPGYRKFVTIVLDNPKLLFRCNQAYDDVSNQNVSSPCSNSAGIDDFSELEFADLCDWREIEIINSLPILTARIPIGNIKMKYFVLVVTITVGWMGCIYILFTLYNLTIKPKTD